MEIFVDGGLFELILAVVFGNLINFIFKRKYLLLIYSVSAILSPLLILLFRNSDIFYFCVSFCLVNAVLFVILLWKDRRLSNDQLFDIASLKSRVVGGFKHVKAPWKKFK